MTEDYVYDDADKLLEVNVGQQTVKEFTYDSAGRTTAVETSAGTTTLSYDYESRVTGITYPGQATNSFSYNGLDTRVGMTDSGGSKTFLRDGVSVTSPVLSDGSANYTPAISERRSSTTTFYHGGIKNGDSQSSPSESVTGSIQYDAFGNVTSSSGTWQGPFAYGGPYGYQEDPDSGLKLLGHRYYDPSTGRFLTRDPVKDGRNWYGYCDNSPIRYLDPSGLLRVFDMEFTWEVVKDGLTTGVHGLASGMTFGLYDGGDHKNDPGFGGSKVFGGIASVSLIAAGATAVVSGVTGITTRVAVHGAHHTFGRLGQLPHIQLNWWKPGVKGSGGAFRIPLPRFPWR